MEGKLGSKGRKKLGILKRKKNYFIFFLWNNGRILLKMLNSSGYCISQKYMSRHSHWKSAVA